MADLVLGGGPQPRTKVTQVVGVRAGEDVGESLLTREHSEDVVELGLAVVAAVGAVRAVGLLVDLLRPHGPVTDACGLGRLAGGLELSERQGWRHGRNGERALTELPRGDRGDERGIDAAGESDDDAPHIGDRGAQTFRLL